MSARNAILAVIVLAALTVRAGPGLQFGGSMYTDVSALHDYRADGSDNVDFSGMSTLSLTFRNANRTHGKIEGSLDVLMPYGVAAEAYMQSTDASLPVVSALAETAHVFSFGTVPVLLDLRKLYLAFYLPFADFAFGRQIVNFGKGLVFSPTDVFSEVMVGDLDLRRRGSDVATVRVPLGDLAGIDAIGELPFLRSPYAAALKAYATFFGFDFSLVGIYRHPGGDETLSREGLVGVTFKGDLEVGACGEIALHMVEGAGRAYAEAMAGVDYSVRNTWLFAAEYLYKDHRWRSSQWGEHNAYVSVQFLPTDLLAISASLIYDFEHDMALGTLLAHYNILQNVNVSAYVRGFNNFALVPYDFAYGMRAEVLF